MDVGTILLAVMLAVAGTSALAYFIGPNMFIGLRIGTALLDRRVWKKIHLLLTVLLLISSAAFAILTKIISSQLVLIICFSLLLTISTVIAILKSIRYAEEILSFEPMPEPTEVKEIERFEARTETVASIALAIIFYGALLASLPFLPERLAIRFNLAGNPVVWEDKLEFAVSISLVFLLMLALMALFVSLGKRYPVLVHAGILSEKFGREALYRLIVWSILAGEVIFLFALAIIILYNVSGFILPGYIGIPLTLAIALLPLLLVIMGRAKS